MTNDAEINIEGEAGSPVQFVGNRAQEGAAIYTLKHENLKLNYAEFTGNLATAGYDWDLTDPSFADIAQIHADNIRNTVFDSLYGNAYNNHDIYYAKGTQTHIVTYYYNHGDDSIYMRQLAESGMPLEKPADPELAELAFLHWSRAADGSRGAYDFGANTASNIELYAQWGIPYDIVYHMNDGTDRKYIQEKLIVGEPYYMLNYHDVQFVRPGYVFTGWNTETNGSGTRYNPRKLLNFEAGAFDFYAQWQKAQEGRTGKQKLWKPYPHMKNSKHM